MQTQTFVVEIIIIREQNQTKTYQCLRFQQPETLSVNVPSLIDQGGGFLQSPQLSVILQKMQTNRKQSFVKIYP